MADKHTMVFTQGDLEAEVTFLDSSDGLTIMHRMQQCLDDADPGFYNFGNYCIEVRSTRPDRERILCAAIYVDTGNPEPPRRSSTYPETGIVFAAWRHGDCFTSLNAWAERLSDEERDAIETIQEHQLNGRNQGFLTSQGRYVDRQEAADIAWRAGQVDRKLTSLISENLY